jgi:hypothetical protein
MLATGWWNTRAGEDIRWVDQAVADRLGLPTYDYYLIDDERLVILDHDQAHELTSVTVITDERAVIDQHRAWRDTVWHHAIPHEDHHLAH